MKGEGLSGVEKLRERLYRREEGLKSEEALSRSPLTPERESGQLEWVEPKTNGSMVKSKKKSSWLIGFLLFALIFFLGAVGFAVFNFYQGDNWIEAGNVEIEVAGPITLASGSELDLQVLVTNKNKVVLEEAKLIAEYPSGTRSVVGAKPLPRETITLGSIKPGESVSQSLKALVFGEKDSTQDIRLSVEYRLPGSGAIFDRKQTYSITINSSPLILGLDLPEEATTGEEIRFKINLEAASVAPLKDILLRATYPPGFTFKRAEPVPSLGDNLWRLGDFSPGAKREITFTGVIEGENDETKSFRFAVGAEDPEVEGEIGLNYGSLFKVVTIRRPEVDLEVVLDGDRGNEQVASSDQVIRADITFINNLPVEVRDGKLEIKLTGRALKPGSVIASQGFYNSLDNSIVWTKVENPDLAVIPPGGSGRASFSFSGSSLIGDGGQTINLTATFKASKTLPGSSAEVIQSTVNKKIKLNSVIQFSSKALHGSGQFTEIGPLPPKVGVETTYTVVWSVANTASDVDGVEVRATLPAYMKWRGVTAPLDEKIRFEPNGGEIIWEPGLVKAGRGFASPPRQVTFQLGLLPSLSQVGTAPALTSETVLRGRDTFTGTRLETRRPALDTILRSEPSFRLGDEKVNP